jgi:protein required for attachment to host cells
MKTWILVADSARARLFEIGASDGQLFEVGGYANPEAQIKPSDLAQDRLPRTHESASAVRHAKEPHTDPHDKTAQKFAHGLAEILEQGRTAHNYTRLLLVAPARFLGHLNHALGAQVAKLVAKTISKDYSRADATEIKAMLDAHD